MLLVKFSGEWADEMDVLGFKYYKEEKDFWKDLALYLQDKGKSSKWDSEVIKKRKNSLRVVGNAIESFIPVIMADEERDVISIVYKYFEEKGEENIFDDFLVDVSVGTNQDIEDQGFVDFIYLFEPILDADEKTCSNIGLYTSWKTSTIGVFPLH